jgi:hypothetical protein
MIKVYVAGKYNDSNVISVLENMRLGMRTCTELLLAGYAPFCPWLDYQFQLMLHDNEELRVEDYYDYSMAWLEASDCVLTLPNYINSNGALKEIKRARELGIPVYYSKQELIKNK